MEAYPFVYISKGIFYYLLNICVWLTLRMNGEGPDIQSPDGLTISFWVKHFLNTTFVDVVTNHNTDNNGISITLNNHKAAERKMDWSASVRSKTVIWSCNILGGLSALRWTHYAMVLYPNNEGIASYLNGKIACNNTIKSSGTGNTCKNCFFILQLCIIMMSYVRYVDDICDKLIVVAVT